MGTNELLGEKLAFDAWLESYEEADEFERKELRVEYWDLFHTLPEEMAGV